MVLKKFTKAAVAAVLVWGLGSAVFYLGFYLGTLKPRMVTVEGVKNIENENVADFKVFWEAWQIIKDDYFRADDVSNRNLVYGAISGLLDSLGDPNSVFFPPEEFKKFKEDINGTFEGIGAEIGIRDKQLIIVAPLKNTPAERAGLRSGDKILKIDEKIAVDMNVPEAISLIRGVKGTEVNLTILRSGWEEPKVISIIRSEIVIPSIDWEMRENKIAYVRLYNFNENVPLSFYKTMIEVLTSGAKGIVLDLRNNPGGFLEVSVNLAGWFLERGEVVVKEKFRSGDVAAFRASGNEALKSKPLVVLVNQGSASASEILAGALRDNRKIKLIGEKTFGKGTVQELKNLEGGASVKISVAEWLLPSGTAIEKVGLAPDYEASLTDDDIEAERDPQLEKAIEVLKAQIK